MKYWRMPVAVLLVAGLAGPALAAGKFEGITVPGTTKASPAFFEINVATGKVTSVWSNTATEQYPVLDGAALPAGDYHLYVSANPGADGALFWMVNRMESETGRVWSLTGGGSAPLAWMEVLPPK